MLQKKRSLAMAALLAITSLSILTSEPAVLREDIAAKDWNGMSVREQYSFISGVMLGATFFGRSYDAAHPGNVDTVMSYYRNFHVSTGVIRDLINRVYKSNLSKLRSIPLTALILRWDEIEKELKNYEP
jgi:hypothetical protein